MLTEIDDDFFTEDAIRAHVRDSSGFVSISPRTCSNRVSAFSPATASVFAGVGHNAFDEKVEEFGGGWGIVPLRFLPRHDWSIDVVLYDA